MQSKHDVLHAGKDFNDYLKSNQIVNQLKDDCAWTKEDLLKKKKKVMSNNPLNDELFSEKTIEKECFGNDLFQMDREDLLFKSNRQLTSKNKRVLKTLRQIKKYLTNIIDYSKQHCELCKVMNITQESFSTKSFEQDK